MLRRNFLKLAGVSVFTAGVCGLGGCSRDLNIAKTNKNQPNIIFILGDDLGIGDLGCYGQKNFRTPNIDSMADDGMLFTQAYSGSTVCAPSRCVLMTGLHTGNCSVIDNCELEPEGQCPMKESDKTVATLLKRVGYKTGLVGKWGLGAPQTGSEPVDCGFDYFYGFNCQRHAHHYYPEYLWQNRSKVVIKENQDGKRGVFVNDLFNTQSVRFIEENADKPFFLYLALSLPHADLDVPDRYVKPFEGVFEETPFEGNKWYIPQTQPRATYAGMVACLDETVGLIRDKVRSLGIEDNTVLIFTSDNGVHSEGGHSPEYFNCNGVYRGKKRDLYEGGIHVPFIATWKGAIPASAKSEHICSFQDFLPTAAELAGVDVPFKIDGISMIEELKGNSSKQKKHQYLYWEFKDKRAVRMGKWKAVSVGDKSPIELYDLSADPSEHNDVAALQPDITALMAKYIVEAGSR